MKLSGWRRHILWLATLAIILAACGVVAGLAGMVFVGAVTLAEHRLVAAKRRQST